MKRLFLGYRVGITNAAGEKDYGRWDGSGTEDAHVEFDATQATAALFDSDYLDEGMSDALACLDSDCALFVEPAWSEPKAKRTKAVKP